MKKRVSCRKTRRAIHDVLDRMHPASMKESGDPAVFLTAEVHGHLEGCPGCRDFLHSLGTFRPVLRAQFDAALKEYTGPEVAIVLEGANAPGSPAVAPFGLRGGSIPSALRKLRDLLFGPAGKPLHAIRLTAVAALATLAALVAVLICIGGVRIYTPWRTRRMIEQQVERIVAGIYQEPLLPGVESALLRTQPSLSDYMEELSGTAEPWGDDTGLESYLD